MKSSKRILILSLAILIVFCVFAACSVEGNENPDATKDSQTTLGGDSENNSEIKPDIPDNLKFDGRTFRIITSPYSGDAYTEIYLDYEDRAEDTISNAVYKRNAKVVDRFGIELEVLHSNNWYTVVQDIIDLNQSDYPYYDAAFAPGGNVGVAALEGHFNDLNDLSYVNFENPYWDSNCYEALSIGGKNFLMVGDISMSVLSLAHMTIFNKQMLKDNNIDADPYQLVRNGEWTFDKMHEMIKGVAKENGDGVQNEKDIYGLFNLNMTGVLYSFDYSLTKKDANDYPEMFELTSKFDEVFNMLRELNNNKELHFVAEQMLSSSVNVGDFGHIWDWVRGNMFPNDQILFMYAGFATTNLLRDMRSDYGIVPNAKLDTNQSRYQCMIDFWADFMCVPSTNADNDFTGAVLEYMAYESSDTIRYEYIETFLKNKRNRDDEMKEMVDIIIDSLHYDISDIFGLGMRKIIEDSTASGDLQRQYDKLKVIYVDKINDLTEKLKKLDED